MDHGAGSSGTPLSTKQALPQLQHRQTLNSLPEQSSSQPQGVDGILAQLASNNFFAGGLGLAGLGAAVALAQRSVRNAAILFKRRLLVDVEINVKDESYPWFLHWMTAHQRFLLNSGSVGSRQNRSPAERFLQRFTPRIHHLSVKTDVFADPNGSVRTQFSLLPGPGKHVLRYQRAFLLVERVRETKTLDITRGGPWETITITTLYSQRHVLQELLKEAHHMAKLSTQGKTIVYASRGLSWEMLGEPRRKRPFESVILDKGVKERVLKDIKDFLSSENWYHERGIPHRRGYLLYGSPGSGKSSVIQALAGELDYNIATLNLSERGLTDDRLNYLLTKIPQRTIILLEDADAAFSNRRTQTDVDGYQGANVTFSGLLNAIDGVSSVEERLLFLTTNHMERLDEALIRPGRIDMAVKVAEASRWQAAELWDRFYGTFDGHETYRAKFLQRLTDFGFVSESRNSALTAERAGASMAALQGLFLYNKDNMVGAVEMVEDLASGASQRDSSKPIAS